MNAYAQGALMMATGGVAVRLGLSDQVFAYIKPSYAPYQVIAGVVLLVLGALALKRAFDGADPGAEHDDVHVGHGHDHAEGPRVAWMLALPLFAVLLIAPPPLGSFAANRQSGVVANTTSTFGELPAPVDGAVELSLQQYSVRALYDPEQSLDGATVRLTGFVSRLPEEGSGWLLTRFALSCCAADGQAINVEVVGSSMPPAVDTWVEVEGTWALRDGHVPGELTADPPLIEAASVRIIDPPAEPYEG